MAPDDDYWRHRHAQDDRRWAEDRAAEQRRRLNHALRRRDYDEARRITGVPPAEAGPDDLDDLDDLDAFDDLDDPDDLDEPAPPPTAGEQFREHKNALLFNLEWVYDFLMPRELREDWMRRVAPLEIEQAEAGLAAIEAIRDEFQRAVWHHEPTNSEVSRRMDWEWQVPRIGEEIDWVEQLFRHVLSFR